MTIAIKEYSFTSSNGVNPIFGLAYVPEADNSKGYIQILHDKNDHITRYEDVMHFFASHGYVCFGHDHMGHGKSVLSNDRLGFFDGEDSEIRLIDDANLIYEKVKSDYPVIKVNVDQKNTSHDASPALEQESTQVYLHGVIGIGLGALIAKLFVIKYPDANALILCGDKGPDPLALFELAFCNFRIRRFGRDDLSHRVDAWLEGKNNKYVTNPKDIYEWHTRDNSMLENYKQDRLSTFRYSLGAYEVFFRLEKMWNNGHWYRAFPHFLATYIIAGSYDPVSNYTRNLTPMISKFKQTGAKNVFHRFYEEARHDLLFEINRRQVLNDVLEFIRIIQRQQLKTKP